MTNSELRSKERQRFLQKGTRQAEKIAKSLDKLVILAERSNCACYAHDAHRIFEYIEKCVAQTKGHLLKHHESA